MSGTLEKRRRTAIHEAGHSVIARAAGFEVDSVTLHEGGGECLALLPPSCDTREHAKRELAFLMAGRVAVALEAGEYLWRLDMPELIEREVRHWPDRAPGLGWYRQTLADLYGSPRAAEDWLETQLPIIRTEVARVLRVRWDEVVNLAQQLLKEGAVDFRAREAPVSSSALRLQRATPLKRKKVTSLHPNEVARCLRVLASKSSSAVERSYVRGQLVDGGYSIQGTFARTRDLPPPPIKEYR